MAITLVQTGSGSTGTFAWTNTLGHLLIAIGRGPSTGSFSDGVNTWQSAIWQNNGSNGIGLWYAMNCAAGARTITNTGFTVNQFVYLEYSGIVLSNALAQTHSATGSGTAYAAGAVTTTSTNALIVGVVANETANSLTDTPSGGFTDRNSFAGNVFTADRVVSSIAAYSYGGSLSSSVTWEAAVAVFLPPVVSVQVSPFLVGL